MTLAAGSRLGPYEILGQIGAGGMGEVYRAKDPRLSREVAIKVLPASFSADADRLRRFEQEAKAAGVLNHPNITAVYDIGEVDGAPYVVQELLEGDTLRSVLAGGKLSARKAIDYATQLSHGLAAAHEKGIVHRDLKPENLFVTKDGRLKILDFGLAKLTQVGEGSGPQTNLPTASGTEPGVVMGTLGYMSPEQVKGKPADARSDIFAFGAILYEMLSGKRAFHADSAGETMAAILREDPPDLSVTNQSISPGLERIVRHCLEKNPEQRFHSAHDLGFDLAALSGTTGQAAAMPSVRRRFRLAPVLLVGLGALAGATIAYLGLRRAQGASATAGLAGATFRRLTNLSGAENWPALSPDGQTVAFVHRAGNNTDIWIQRAGGRNPIDLTPDCDGESYFPAFSPDGSLIAYGAQCAQGGGLFVMGATGESSRRLTSVGSSPAWSPDGREIVYATELLAGPYGRTGTSALWAIDVASGKTRKLSGDFDAIQPNVSPHGLRIAYWGLPTGGGQRDIWTMPSKGLGAGEQPVPVTQDEAIDFNPVWGPDGRTLYFLSNRNGSMNLWRVPIDEATGKTLGPAEPRMLPAREVGGFALSRDGRHAAYVVRENTYSLDRVVFDPASGKLTGKPEAILASSQEMADVDVTADGAFVTFDSRGGARDDLFLVESNGKNLRQITDDPPKDRGASFSPDGRRLAFHSDRGGKYQIWTIERDGSGLKVLSDSKDLIIEAQWSPDGRAIATNSGRSGSILRLDERGIATGLEPIPPPAPDTFFDPLGWSPDGKTIAGSVVRLPDLVSQSLAVYSPGPGAAVRPVRGTEGIARIRRGAFLGTRFLVYVDRGLHVADLESGEHHVVLERPAVGNFQDVACARTGGLCFAVRTSDNADIWQMTLPSESAAK